MTDKIKAAVEQIKEIVKKNELVCSVVIADGEGHAEYLLFICNPDVPWSRFFYNKEEGVLHLKSKGDEEREDLKKTVNGILCLRDVIQNQSSKIDQIADLIEDNIPVTKEEGKWS